MAQRFSLPAAIVLGAALIATGIAVGLRRQTVVYVSSPAAPASTPVVQHPVSGWTPVSAEVQGEVARQAREALEAEQARLIERCWRPPAGKKPQQEFEFRLIFDPRGHLASYGVNDPADVAYRPIAECLRQHAPDVAVTAVGQHVTVQLALAFP